MRHAWQRHPDSETIRRPCVRIRLCGNCGAEQTWESEQNWGKISRRFWYPLVGRCAGKRSKKMNKQLAQRRMALRDEAQALGLDNLANMLGAGNYRRAETIAAQAFVRHAMAESKTASKIKKLHAKVAKLTFDAEVP